MPDAIENYLRQTARVLVPGGSAFISVFLFDLAAEIAVRNGTTIFDFRQQVGPCLTFHPQHPEEFLRDRIGTDVAPIAPTDLRDAKT